MAHNARIAHIAHIAHIAEHSAEHDGDTNVDTNTNVETVSYGPKRTSCSDFLSFDTGPRGVLRRKEVCRHLLAVFKTVAGRFASSRVGSTPMRSRH